jgi:hypothetical protein
MNGGSPATRSGVAVVGMDRSGTSALTQLITQFGLRPPVDGDLIDAREANPTGVWESRSLTSLNTRVLQAVGSDERFPLPLAMGWETDQRLDALRSEAREAFARSFPVQPWAWKDPLHCLTFAFWRHTLDVAPAVILVIRNPLEIAASAARAWGREKIFGLALWERYLRQALAQIEGLPIVVASYEDMLQDPSAWGERTHAALDEAGVAVGAYREDDLVAAIDRRLRHAEYTREDLFVDAGVSPAQRELYDLLFGLKGLHTVFVTPSLPDETPTTDVLLAERRRAFEIKGRFERLLAEERQLRGLSRLRRSKYIASARRAYTRGRSAIRALAQKLDGH